MARALSASNLRLLLLLACCALGHVLAQVASSESACVAEECTALMQVNVKVKASSLGSGASEEGNEPLPVGRTILSTAPQEAAAWMVQYYENATLLSDLPGCANGDRAGVKLDLGSGETQILIFIQPSGGKWPVPFSEVIDATHIATIEVFEKGSGLNYTSWLDNNDGFQSTSFDISTAVDDGELVGKAFHYLDDGEVLGGDVVYFVAHTMYAIDQVHGGMSSKSAGDLYMNDCMLSSSTSRRTSSRRPWWKASFAVGDPAIAYSFAEKVLGAEPGVAQYPWPPAKDCTAEKVARFPESGFELHFVSSPEYQSPRNAIQVFTEMVLEFRDLSDGAFDPFMYNSLIMTVKNLDPYIERLRAQSRDFLLLNVGTSEYALFMTIPGSDSMVQLRSKSVSLASPMDKDSCLQEFPIDRA